MSVDDPSSTHYNTNHTWTPSVKNSSRGCAEYNISELSEENINVVWLILRGEKHFDWSFTVLNPVTNNLSQLIGLRHSTLQQNTHEHLKNSTFSPTASPYLGNMALSGPPSATDSDDDDNISTSLRIGVVIHRARDGYVARANTLQSFLALNRHVRSAKYSCSWFFIDSTHLVPYRHYLLAPIWPQQPIINWPEGYDFLRFHDRRVDSSGREDQHQEVCHRKTLCHRQDGEDHRMRAHGSLHNCRWVGPHYCGWTIFHSAELPSRRAKLDGSILGKNTKVGTKSELIRCITQAGYEVVPGGTYWGTHSLLTVDVCFQKPTDMKSSMCQTGRQHLRWAKTMKAIKIWKSKTCRTVHKTYPQRLNKQVLAMEFWSDAKIWLLPWQSCRW